MRWLDKVLDEVGDGKYQYVQVFVLGGVVLLDGAEMLVCSSILGALQSTWQLSSIMKGLMMSMVFVGCILGSCVAGPLSDKLGRLPAYLVAYFAVVMFCLGSAFTNNKESMLVLRMMLGAGIGAGISPCMALIVESASSVARKNLVNTMNIWFAMGEVYASCLLIYFMPTLTDNTDWNWRMVVIFSAVPSAVMFPLAVCFLRETPHFLLSQGRKAEAVAAVKEIAAFNGREDAVAGLEGEAAGESDPILPQRHHGGSEQSSGSYLAQGSLPQAPGRANDAVDNSLAERLQTLWQPGLRPILIGGTYLCFVSNLLFYGLSYSLLPIFMQMGDHVSPSWQTLIASMMDLPGMLLTFVINWCPCIGHRDGLFVLGWCMTLLQLGLISVDYLPQSRHFVLVSVHLSKFVVGAFFNLTYIYIGEVFPSDCRCTAVSICTSGGRIGSVFAPLLFEILRAPLGDSQGARTHSHVAYFGFNAACALLAVLAVRYLLTYELKNEPLYLARRRSREGIPPALPSKDEPLPVPAA